MPLSDWAPGALRVVAHGPLAGFPRSSDAELIASEFATNAVRARYRDPTLGRLVATIERHPSRIRLEISYNTIAKPDTGWDEEETCISYAHGLTIINTLADRWGYDMYADLTNHHRHNTWWAELDH